MFLSSNWIPCFERNSFVDSQNIQPGCENTVTFFRSVIEMLFLSAVGSHLYSAHKAHYPSRNLELVVSPNLHSQILKPHLHDASAKDSLQTANGD
jgi:hypothetical protein